MDKPALCEQSRAFFWGRMSFASTCRRLEQMLGLDVPEERLILAIILSGICEADHQFTESRAFEVLTQALEIPRPVIAAMRDKTEIATGQHSTPTAARARR